MTLPEPVERTLADFTAACQRAFGDGLVSVVLYGSAAEGAHRPASDVNVLVVVRAFDPAAADALRESYRVAASAVRLGAMFLREDEVAAAASAFAEKFADVARRRRVLFGGDPFSALAIPRDVLLERLSQVLLNLSLRLRERYVARSLREEQAARALAEAGGPLRSAAASLLALSGSPAPSAKEALRRLVAELDPGAAGAEALELLSAAREERTIPPGAAAPALFRAARWAEGLRARAVALASAPATR